ncbi:MAG: cation:dicarboxylate symporter family transporter [Thiohalomonadales bacterium]
MGIKLINFFKNMSAFKRVVLALILGILTGIFFGEPTGNLRIIGNAYIGLLQMTVLPYVLVSIIGGLGRLDSDMAKNIGTKAALVILFIWLATMATLLLLPLAYPDWEAAGFFSTSLIAESQSFDFLRLYIPSNIFYSMANTIVPAVVLFSLLLGIALINVSNKDVLINLATNISDGLMKVASYVAKLAPIGIFAIAAAAAGTLQPEELGRLQIFLWVYLIAWTLLTLVLLPLLIHWATPFSYREIMNMAGEAMITALATGTVLVVLPMIIERCKELLKKHNMDTEATMSTVDVLVPTAYSFPSVGTLLGLGFILFSAWYVGSPLSLEQYASYTIMGVFSAFGSMAVAIPFMLDFFNLPADQFQLYLLGSVVTARFATALAALHAFVVTLMVSAAVLNRLNKKRMLNVVGIHLGVTAGIMIIAGFTFKYMIPYQYEGDKTFNKMSSMEPLSPVTAIDEPVALTSKQLQQARLDVIRQRGSIRIGYPPNSLPFAFRNDKGQVVGFDMEMMHALAKDLNIKIETTRLKDYKSTLQMLNDGRLDIVVGGKPITPKRAINFLLTDAYTFHSVGFLLQDSIRDKFSTLEDVQNMKDLQLYVPNTPYYIAAIKKLFPNATYKIINNPRKFFSLKHKKMTAYVYSAEVGAAWTLLYPAYSVVIPKGLKIKAPVGFALTKGQLDFAQYINTWLKLKKYNGFQQSVYNYWILGKNISKQKPRWSVAHDVLGWTI